MEVPFEVVGYKQLFAHMLNQACRNTEDNSHKNYKLTQDDLEAICKGKFCALIKLKLQSIIDATFKKASGDIKAKGLISQVAWCKSNYKYNYDLSLWDADLQIPNHVLSKIHDYVQHLDLEKDFEVTDLILYRPRY